MISFTKTSFSLLSKVVNKRQKQHGEDFWSRNSRCSFPNSFLSCSHPLLHLLLHPWLPPLPFSHPGIFLNPTAVKVGSNKSKCTRTLGENSFLWNLRGPLFVPGLGFMAEILWDSILNLIMQQEPWEMQRLQQQQPSPKISLKCTFGFRAQPKMWEMKWGKGRKGDNRKIMIKF